METLFPVWISTFTLVSALLAPDPSAQDADKARAYDSIPTNDGPLNIYPGNHATFAMQWKKVMIYVDPVGGPEVFAGLPRPDIILITDIHSDHFSKETLVKLADPATRFVCPPAAAQQLPSDLRGRATTLSNGQTQDILGIRVEAMPAYNLAADRQKFHPKGRGNGYLLTCGGKRIYLSGDTEDIPQMLALRNIDVAFVCMNLPYTMDAEQAARAVRAFKPKVVYPYHYRGSDTSKFKELVGADAGIEVRLRDWYAKP